MNRVAPLFFCVLLAGCATTNWRHPSIDNPADEARQLKIDDGYCQRVVAGSAPMPNVYIPPSISGQTFSGSINTYNPSSGYTQSTFTGYTAPSAGASFTSGFSQGLAMGAAIKAAEQRRAIHTSCMLALGWADSEEEAKRLRTERHAKDARERAAVEAAIEATPELAEWRAHDPVRWEQAIAADSYVRSRPESAYMTIRQRFSIVVDMVHHMNTDATTKPKPR